MNEISSRMGIVTDLVGEWVQKRRGYTLTMLPRLPIRVLMLAISVLTPVAPSVAADVTGEQVKHAIHNAVRALKRAQGPDGLWPERFRAGGETSLATLALLTAGEPADSESLRRALAY